MVEISLATDGKKRTRGNCRGIAHRRVIDMAFARLFCSSVGIAQPYAVENSESSGSFRKNHAWNAISSANSRGISDSGVMFMYFGHIMAVSMVIKNTARWYRIMIGPPGLGASDKSLFCYTEDIEEHGCCWHESIRQQFATLDGIFDCIWGIHIAFLQFAFPR